MAIIEVNHVTKEFRLGEQASMWTVLGHGLKRLAGRGIPQPPEFKALDDIDFRVEEGEVLGIIGSNGAGKSTLLKLLSRISEPTHGTLHVRGRVAPLIEVGAGLITDLSGRENVYLNGAILGMSRAQINRKFDEIIAFAELEQFVDTPVKKYSSGMTIRLGFSIATAIDADLLIVDEVLAVGDLAFQRKCFDRMEDLIRRQGKTVLLVSHNIRQVERLCTRTILLDHGRMVRDGNPHEVCQLFYERSDEKMRRDVEARPQTASKGAGRDDDIELVDIALIDASGAAVEVVPYMQNMTIRVRFLARKPLRRPIFGVGVHTTDQLYLATHDSDDDVRMESVAAGAYEICCRVQRPPLTPGVYALRFGIGEDDGAHQTYYGENLLHFQITAASSVARPPKSPDGFFALDAQWTPPKLTSSAIQGRGERIALSLPNV